MSREAISGDPQNSDGITDAQENLLNLLFETETRAANRRRRQLSNGSYEFYTMSRLCRLIEFSQDEEEFVLKHHEQFYDAPLSPIKFNLRNMPEEVINQIGMIMAHIPTDTYSDSCAGIPQAGVAIAEAFARYRGITCKSIFTKETTPSGTRIVARQHESTQTGITLDVVDDLATQGYSKLEAAHAAESLGFNVQGIIVLIDRQEGAKEQLMKAGYPLYAAFTMDQVLQHGIRSNKITHEQYQCVELYRQLKQ